MDNETINRAIIALEGFVLGYAATSYYLKGNKAYARLATITVLVIAATSAVVAGW